MYRFIYLFIYCVQLGAESADTIGAVLNSKQEQKEIEETRETCRYLYVIRDVMTYYVLPLSCVSLL